MTAQNPTSKPMKFIILVVIPVLAALAFYFGFNSAKPEIDVDSFPPPSIEQLNNTLVSGTEVRTLVKDHENLTFVIYTKGSLLEGDCAVVVGPTLWPDEEVQYGEHVVFIHNDTLATTLIKSDSGYQTDRTHLTFGYNTEWLADCNEPAAPYYVKPTDKYACNIIKNGDTLLGLVLTLRNTDTGE